MRKLLQKYFFKVQVRVMLAWSPALLFHRLSLLDWYGDTLEKWMDGQVTGSNSRVLDLGCATGYLSEYMAQNGCDVSGIDLSETMIQTAKKRNISVDFKVGNANSLPFDDETFDLVASASLINVVSEPAEVVAQMVKVCKHGGCVTFLFPVQGFNDLDLNQCISLLGISGFSEAALTAWHSLAPKMSVVSVEEFLKFNGLNTCEIEYYLNGMVASVSAWKGEDRSRKGSRTNCTKAQK